MEIQSKIVKFVNRRIRRTYCKWALSKKKKSFNELTQFEKKFTMVLKRVCLLPTSEFNYGFTENVGRIVTNQEAGVTIQLKGTEVRFIDSDMLTVFFASTETATYFTSIFDRATELRAKRREDEILNIQMNHIRQVEQILMETPKRKIKPIEIRPKMIRRRKVEDLEMDQADILKIVTGG